MAYAKTTKVPIERTVGEIQKTLTKAGAGGFAFATNGKDAYIAFNLKSTAIKMRVRLLEIKSTHNMATIKTAEQVNRSKWRGLLLCIKAKIESVESGIETFEEAFLSHIVLQDGSSVGSKIIPKLEQLNDTPPALLLGL
jgi:hypothetical protein